MFIFIGIILIIIGIVLFFVQKSQKEKFQSIKTARPSTIGELQNTASEIAKEIGPGNWREYVKVRGTIECSEPLTSELKEEACVYYSMRVMREYEETVTTEDSDGKKTKETQRHSESIASNEQSVPFILRDDTGSIPVNPSGAGGGIETVSVLNEFRPDQAAGGMLSFGRFSRTLSGDLGGQRRTLGYRYSESILPVGRKVLMLANASDGEGQLTLQKPTEAGHKFLISLKSEEDLAASAEKGAKSSFVGMVACVAIGLLLILIGLVAG